MDYSRYKNRNFGIGIRIRETGDIFETRTQCAEYLGVGVSMITMALSGKVKTCKGYHIDLVDFEFIHHITPEILEELYELTGEECEWREHPWRHNVYVSETGLIAKNIRGNIMINNQHLINSGYLVVSVGDVGTITSKNRNVLVHRLVAETYIPNPYDKNFVNHIDGDKTNNAVYNLEWCSQSENMRHAFDNGLYDTEKVMVVETGEIFDSASKCARAIGGSVSGIHDCKTGRQKRHRGYRFKFFRDGDQV